MKLEREACTMHESVEHGSHAVIILVDCATNLTSFSEQLQQAAAPPDSKGLRSEEAACWLLRCTLEPYSSLKAALRAQVPAVRLIAISAYATAACLKTVWKKGVATCQK